MNDERKPCRYCGQPVANQHDWDTVPEGEGIGLCWGYETCLSAEEAIDRLHAELAQYRAAVQTLAGQDFGATGWNEQCNQAAILLRNLLKKHD